MIHHLPLTPIFGWRVGWNHLQLIDVDDVLSTIWEKVVEWFRNHQLYIIMFEYLRFVFPKSSTIDFFPVFPYFSTRDPETLKGRNDDGCDDWGIDVIWLVMIWGFEIDQSTCLTVLTLSWHCFTRWLFSNMFYFHPYLGRCSNLTNIF